VKSTTDPRPAHEALAVVLQVRDGVLQVLLWERAREPFLERLEDGGAVREARERLRDDVARAREQQ